VRYMIGQIASDTFKFEHAPMNTNTTSPRILFIYITYVCVCVCPAAILLSRCCYIEFLAENILIRQTRVVDISRARS